MNKISNRIKLLDRFIKETQGYDITLGEWMKSKGLNPKSFFRSLGYYTPNSDVVSDDSENKLLSYHRNMKYNPDAGYHVPDRRVVSTAHHNSVITSKLGMTYNPALALYFPTTIYDTEAFSQAEGVGDDAMDIMGGFTVRDLANLSAYTDSGRELTEIVRELFEEEFDNVSEEYDDIDDTEIEMFGEQYSGFDIDDCKSDCSKKKTAKKRGKCEEACNRKAIRKDPALKAKNKAEVKAQRKEDRANRKKARKDKRDTKKELKALLKSGKISRAEYSDRMKIARKKKRRELKEAGGNFFSRVFQGIAKIDPTTATIRSALYILVNINAFGFSTRLAPALLPEAEAKEKFKPESIVKAKKGWEKIKVAFRRVGGNPTKLKQEVLKGWMKRPTKISRSERKKQEKEAKSSFTGGYDYAFEFDPNTQFTEEFSNIEATTGVAIAGYVVTGLGLIASLISSLNKSGADKDPFKSGQTPADYQSALNDGVIDDVPPRTSNDPLLDPVTGKWLDPHTGREIDPQTGEYADDILGMNKWVAIGIGTVLLTAIVVGVIIKKTPKVK